MLLTCQAMTVQSALATFTQLCSVGYFYNGCFWWTFFSMFRLVPKFRLLVNVMPFSLSVLLLRCFGILASFFCICVNAALLTLRSSPVLFLLAAEMSIQQTFIYHRGNYCYCIDYRFSNTETILSGSDGTCWLQRRADVAAHHHLATEKDWPRCQTGARRRYRQSICRQRTHCRSRPFCRA